MRFNGIAERLIRMEHAQGIILGCTELPLIMTEELGVPYLDVMSIHIQRLIEEIVD